MKTLKGARVEGYTRNSFTRKPKSEHALIHDWPKWKIWKVTSFVTDSPEGPMWIYKHRKDWGLNYLEGCYLQTVSYSAAALRAGRSRVQSSMVPFEFLRTQSFRPHYGLGINSISIINGYQYKFLRGEGGGGLKLSVSRADNRTTFLCRLSWNLGAPSLWNPQDLYRDCLL
jgi:hypothetical protein